MNKDYKEQCWKRYLENQKYEKYDKEDLVDEIMELQQENQQLKKQKDDVAELIIKLYQKEYNKTSDWWLQEELCNNFDDMNIFTNFELERMLGEIDE